MNLYKLLYKLHNYIIYIIYNYYIIIYYINYLYGKLMYLNKVLPELNCNMQWHYIYLHQISINAWLNGLKCIIKVQV